MDAEFCGRQAALGMLLQKALLEVVLVLGAGRGEVFFLWLEDHFGCFKKGEDLSSELALHRVLGTPSSSCPQGLAGAQGALLWGANLKALRL